ncbi:hypothetical protein V6N11_044796 [Hibiscus sabdariffa]|uniref:Uncharacterized protein n=1 Tax=Hibiscus sabdariffa TaxID=183260 RepID=A0ABR2PTX4_9ROSI
MVESRQVGEDFISGCSKLNFQETAGHNLMEISKKGSDGKESDSGNINEILENEKRAETKDFHFPFGNSVVVGGNMTGCRLDFSLSESSKTYWFISLAVALWGLWLARNEKSIWFFKLNCKHLCGVKR